MRFVAWLAPLLLLINVINSLNITGTSRGSDEEREGVQGDRQRQLVYVTQISSDSNVPSPILHYLCLFLPRTADILLASFGFFGFGAKK